MKGSFGVVHHLLLFAVLCLLCESVGCNRKHEDNEESQVPGPPVGRSLASSDTINPIDHPAKGKAMKAAKGKGDDKAAKGKGDDKAAKGKGDDKAANKGKGQGANDGTSSDKGKGIIKGRSRSKGKKKGLKKKKKDKGKTMLDAVPEEGNGEDSNSTSTDGNNDINDLEEYESTFDDDAFGDNATDFSTDDLEGGDFDETIFDMEELTMSTTTLPPSTSTSTSTIKPDKTKATAKPKGKNAKKGRSIHPISGESNLEPIHNRHNKRWINSHGQRFESKSRRPKYSSESSESSSESYEDYEDRHYGRNWRDY